MSLPIIGRKPAGMGFALSRQVGAHTYEIPWDIADEVVKWGREIGRNARMVWNTTLCANYGGCAEVRIELKPDDPRMGAWQAGRLTKEPYEPVFFHEFDPKVGHYRPININELGASGVRARLEEGNMWSGRGAHKDIVALAESVIEHNSHVQEKQTAGVMERCIDRRKERHLHEVPRVNVPKKLEP